MKKILLILGILMLVSFQANADQVILKDGGVVQGKIVERNADKVTVEDIDGVRSSYQTKNVEKVEKELRGADERDKKGTGATAMTKETPELVIQNGHSLRINSVAFSPNGRFIASASVDTAIKLWLTNSGELFRDYYSGSLGPTSVSFSPDSNLLAAGYMDNNIRLWSVENGNLLMTLTGHTDWVNMVAFSPDGKYMASGSSDSTVKIWSSTTGALLYTFDGNTSSVRYVYFITNEMLMSVSDETIMFWSIKERKLLHAINDHGKISINNDILAYVGNSGVINIINISSGKLIRTIKREIYDTPSIMIAKDGDFILANSSDNIEVWDINSGMKIKDMAKTDFGCNYFDAISPDYKIFASINTSDDDSDKDMLQICSMDTFKTVTKINAGKSGWIDSVAFSKDGSMLASNDSSSAFLWSMLSGKLMHKITMYPDVIFTDLAFSADSKRIAVAGYMPEQENEDLDSGIISMWSAENCTLDYSYEVGDWPVTSIALNPNGQTIATASGDNDERKKSGYDIKLWSINDGKLIKSIHAHTKAINNITFSPNGTYLASTGNDGSIRIWSTTTGRLRREMIKDYNKTYLNDMGENSIAFSPDNEFIISGGNYHELNLWSVRSGYLVRTFMGHNDAIYSVAFGPGGQLIASGGCDDVVKIWSLNGSELKTLRGHQICVTSISFNHDGTILASGSADTTVKLWNPSTGQLLITLTAFDNGDWFAQDSAGRFDCSGCVTGDPNEGMKYIRWRAGDTLYKPEQFFRKYFEPGLLADVVKLGYVPPMEDMGTALQTPPPAVTIIEPTDGATLDSDNMKVIVSVKESDNGGAENIRLFVNGRPVDDAPKDITPSDAKQGEQIYEFASHLLPGGNTLMALATSRSGIDSREATITVTSTRQPEKKPELYMVTVGINEYQNPAMNIIFAVEDADGFADEINSKGKDLYGEIHDIRLRNDKATAENLRTTLNGIQSKAVFNDVVIIYYAGHGANFGKSEKQKESFSGGWYLLTHEVIEGNRKYVSEHAFSDLELKAFLKRVKAGKVILVMDSCFSRALPETFTYGIGRDKNLVNLAYGSGATVIAAATGKQESQANANLKHGVFTYFLIDGMSGKADGIVDGSEKNNKVEVKELADYAITEVPAYAKRNNMQAQEPFFWQVAGDKGLGATLVEVK